MEDEGRGDERRRRRKKRTMAANHQHVDTDKHGDLVYQGRLPSGRGGE